MDFTSVLDAAAQRMQRDGSVVTREQLAGFPAVVGYQSRFRLRWFATKLHSFVVFVAAPQASASDFRAVTAEAIAFATARKGKLRGLQSGVAVIPVTVTQGVSNELRSAAAEQADRRFGVALLPAVFDVETRALHVPENRKAWGRIYMSWLRERLDATVGSSSDASA